MSNYPSPPPFSPPPYTSPYSAPPPYSGAPGFPIHPNMLARARRAGALVIVVGVLLTLSGACFGAIGYAIPSLKLPPDIAEQMHQMEVKSGQPLASLAAGILGFGIAAAFAGVYQIVNGLLVRRGGLVPTIIAIVTTCLLLACVLLMSLGGLFSGDAGQFASGLCMVAVVGSLFVWQLFWLIAASREAAQRNLTQANYQAQYWQYQQQQLAYAQAYGQPPPYGVPPIVPQASPYPPPPPMPNTGAWAYGAPPPPPPTSRPEGEQHYPSANQNADDADVPPGE